MASAAINGDSNQPVSGYSTPAAIGIPRALYKKAKARFCFMFLTVACDIRIAALMPRKSPLISVTWALFMATSVPVPMAMPTWALASAGASLMPSPAMATTRPSFCSRVTSASLSAGLTSPRTSTMPNCRATALAVVKPSPVAMMMRNPAFLSAAKASGVLLLTGSETASRPSNCAPLARYITLAPSARKASAWLTKGASTTPTCCISVVLPNANDCVPM